MKKGTKVVCINDAFPTFKGGVFKQWIKKGEVYTVRSVQGLEPNLGLLLEEVINPLIPEDATSDKMMEPGFNIRRFREVESDSMSVLEKEFAYA